MTLWVIGFLLALFIYIAWGFNAIIGALDWDPFDPTIPNTTQEKTQ